MNQPLGAARTLVWLLAGPLLGLVAFSLMPSHYLDSAGGVVVLSFAARSVVGLALWMAVWWLTEVVPLPVTSLLPLAVFPLLGIAAFPAAAAPYADPLIFLFLGGFLLSIAIEKWALHTLLAWRLLRVTGHSPAALVGAVMGITAFISMWISNTATAVLMLPVALSVAGGPGVAPPLRKCLLLGVAYSATIGGMGTLIGTPPNLFVASFLAQHHSVQLNFLDWLVFGLPMVLVMLPFTWWVLTRWCFPLDAGAHLPPSFAASSLPVLTTPARRTLWVFALAAGAWITRVWLVDLSVGGIRPLAGLSDPSIGLLAALALFLIPATSGSATPLLTWPDTTRVPWGTLLLFGGGLSLAAAITATGVDRALGAALADVPHMPAWAVVAMMASVVIFVSEIASNIATAAALTPLLAAAAPALGLTPLVCAVVTGLAASSAYMMPVGTAPNALVYGSGELRAGEMARAGLILNLASVVLITLVGVWLIPGVLG
ncbi:MAG: DASS family sodium-coupled anion symporter [Gammaproteobacteria bacterium]|nr:DASS family sodium-coupled anion symporter [Gammaproteobacteria bacterium]